MKFWLKLTLASIVIFTSYHSFAEKTLQKTTKNSAIQTNSSQKTSLLPKHTATRFKKTPTSKPLSKKQSITYPILCRWPTDNTAFYEGKTLENYIQSTCSGNPISGTYGCVRNNGTRFHEGIDIKSIHRGRKNIPQDKIFACLPGTIAYINEKPGTSLYGKYIVIEHTEHNLHFYSMYAHLNEVSKTLKVGQKIQQGTHLGQMGHSSCSTIPISRAHLHFEIGLKLGSDQTFQQWYLSQKFSSRNYHGEWNGMNLVGLDPLAFLKSKTSFKTFLQNQPTAFTLKIYTEKPSQYIKKNSALITQADSSKKIYGWQVSFNWVGAPLHFEPIFSPSTKKILLHFYDKNELFRLGNRHTLEFDVKGKPYIGKTLQRQLFCLWGENFPTTF